MTILVLQGELKERRLVPTHQEEEKIRWNSKLLSWRDAYPRQYHVMILSYYLFFELIKMGREGYVVASYGEIRVRGLGETSHGEAR